MVALTIHTTNFLLLFFLRRSGMDVAAALWRAIAGRHSTETSLKKTSWVDSRPRRQTSYLLSADFASVFSAVGSSSFPQGN